MNKVERLMAENALLKADIRLLEAGRETINAQAEACTFRANKNAEAYNEIKTENAKLRELLALAVDGLKYNCDYCKYKETDCKNCRFGTDGKWDVHWQWQHADKLKELGILQDET